MALRYHAVLTQLVLSQLEPIVRDRIQLRSSLIAAAMMGVLFGRYVLGLPGLVDVTTEELATALGPALQHYVTGDLN